MFGSARVQYVADYTLRIVFLNAEPSIVMTYDTVQSLHTVWALRRVKPEVQIHCQLNIIIKNFCVCLHALMALCVTNAWYL